MTTPYFQVSRTAARALEEFSDEFREALTIDAGFPLWAANFGLVRNTDALKTTFPIPVSAAGYNEFRGDMKYRGLYARSLSMIGRDWQDGVEELAKVIEAPDFIDWAGEPARMAIEWNRLPNQVVADMLALSSLSGPLLDFYRDPDTNTASTRRLFATDHPYNVLDTSLGSFDNTMTTTHAAIASGAFFDACDLRFSQVMGPNGKPMGLRFIEGGTCLVPATLANEFKNVLKFDTLVRAVDNVGKPGATASVVAAVTQNNVYKGTLSYQRADELANQSYFYAIAAGKPGCFPWVVQRGTTEEIIHDKNSEKYKNTRKISFAAIGQLEAAACLPHRIIRVQVTG